MLNACKSERQLTDLQLFDFNRFDLNEGSGNTVGGIGGWHRSATCATDHGFA
jgi:hypothetical protein